MYVKDGIGIVQLTEVLIYGFVIVTTVTLWVPLVEQKLLNL